MGLSTVLGGPGPSTLLFRQLRLASSRLPSSARATPRRHTSTASLPPRQAADGPSPNESATSQRTITSSSSTPLRQEPGEAPSITPIAAAPPTASVDTDEALDQLRTALKDKNLGKLILAWGGLVKLQQTGACTDSDYAAVSDVIDTKLSNPRLSVLKLHTAAPEPYRQLRHMAIEAAARDKWQGLHRFQLELLAFGLPSEAASTFLEFKRRRRSIEGKEDLSGATSPDRAVRIATRLTGEGMKPILLAHIATLTMLDKFDNTHVTDLLDTTADFRPEMMKSLDWDDIRKSLVRANGGRDMGDKFTHNLERFNLILLVYHTDALNVRVRIWSEQDSRKAIIDLYDAIMAASIGKDRLIVPQDLNEAGRLKYHSNVPLVADTWALFIDAFSRLGELDRVVKVIAEDIPLRYDGRPPSEDLLSSALKGMGYLATDTRFDRKLRKEASKQCDLLWETMVKAGMQSAKTIGRRMVALPSGRAGEIEKLYKAGLASLRQQQISGQDIYLDMAFFTHLCSTNQVDRAVRLLATRRQTDSKEERSLFQVMVRNALTEPLPYRERQRLYRALMKHKLPSARVYSGTYGIILRYLLEGNSDLQTACRMICAHSAESEPINWYMNLMLGLLVRGYREPSPRDFDAAVFILTTLVPRLDNAPQFKYLNLWRVAARSVAQATTIPAHERHEHLVALLDSFPGRKHYLDILRRNVIRYSASRNDAQGIPEALHHYKVLDKQVDGPLDYRVLIEYLVKHGQPQLAQEVVDDMPRDWRYGFVRAMARRLGLDVEGAVGFASAAEDTASAAEVAFQERVEEAEEEEDAEEGAVQSAREFGV